MKKATFIILVPNGSNASIFNSLYKECLALKRKPLSVGFVEACLEERMIVNEDDYEVEAPKGFKGKTGRPAGSNAAKREPTSSQARSGDKPPVFPKATVESAMTYRDCSPTPPPVFPLKNGFFAHTEVEKQYILNWAARLFRDDINATMTKLFQEISARVRRV